MTIERIKGRTDDMIIYKGVKFYPSDIEQILATHGILHYKIEVGEYVKISFESDDRDIIPRIEKDIKEFLGFKPKIEVLPVGTLERFEGKAKRLYRVVQ